MPSFSTPSTQKKIPAECWRAKKIICKRILEKKIFIVNQGVEKKFHDQTKSPTPRSEVKWSAPYMLFSIVSFSRNHTSGESDRLHRDLISDKSNRLRLGVLYWTCFGQFFNNFIFIN